MMWDFNPAEPHVHMHEECNEKGGGGASAGGLLCIWQEGYGADAHMDISVELPGMAWQVPRQLKRSAMLQWAPSTRGR